jgi:hypothetical protein
MLLIAVVFFFFMINILVFGYGSKLASQKFDAFSNTYDFLFKIIK